MNDASAHLALVDTAAAVEKPSSLTVPTRGLELLAELAAYWPLAPLAPAGIAAAWLLFGKGSRRSSTRRLIGGAVGVAVLAGIARWQLARRFIENAEDRVERRFGKLEVRRYPDRIQAETEVPEVDFDHALDEGFRRLFGYISGENAARDPLLATTPEAARPAPTPERVAMTTPVTVSRTEDGHVVSFIMPADRALLSLPAPGDSRVTLREVAGHRVAALKWRGLYRAASVIPKMEELFTRIRAAGLSPLGEPHFAGYDAPSTLPPMRRNEVWIAVA